MHTLSPRPRLDQLNFEFLQLAVGGANGVHPEMEMSYFTVLRL